MSIIEELKIEINVENGFHDFKQRFGKYIYEKYFSIGKPDIMYLYS